MEKEKQKFSRRSFLKGIGGGAIGTAVVSTGLVKVDPAQAYIAESTGAARGKTAVALKVNGKSYRVEVEHRETLAEVLRDELGLTGTKIGCDRGECGACTVIIDGRNMYSCSQLRGMDAGQGNRHRRGAGKGRQARSGAGSIYRTRRAAMRLLHFGTDHVRQGAADEES